MTQSSFSITFEDSGGGGGGEMSSCSSSSSSSEGDKNERRIQRESRLDISYTESTGGIRFQESHTQVSYRTVLSNTCILYKEDVSVSRCRIPVLTTTMSWSIKIQKDFMWFLFCHAITSELRVFVIICELIIVPPLLIYVAPLRRYVRCTLTELRCTLTELRCTLTELRCTLTELRRTLTELRNILKSWVVRAADCQFKRCASPGFNLSKVRQSGIWGAAIKQCWIK